MKGYFCIDCDFIFRGKPVCPVCGARRDTQ